MEAKYIQEIINRNIKDGTAMIHVRTLSMDGFIDIPIENFARIEFACFVYYVKYGNIIETNYIPVDGIVHIRFEKELTK